MKKLIWVVIALSLLSCPASFAQRTSKGYCTLEASAGITDTSLGAQFAVGINSLSGYWNIGILATNRAVLIKPTYHALSYLNTVVEGGYMYRVASSVNRRINFYAGGDAILGTEIIDPLQTIPSTVVPPVSGTKFIYGVQANVSLEWYIIGGSALTLRFTAPVTFGSRHPMGIFSFFASAGYKITLF